jgi:hypothetical protein
MAALLGLPPWLFVLGFLAAVAVILYFVVRELKTDHATGEYNFTWGLGIVVLFLLGFAPGLVGLGLYLTVERGFPFHWLVAFVVTALAVVGAVGYGVQVTAVAG